MLRVTGKVVRTDNKSGTKVDTVTGEARTWSFDNIKVLVASQAVVEVTRFSDSATALPVVGADVDYAVEVAARGGRLNINLDKPWAALFPPVPAPARAA